MLTAEQLRQVMDIGIELTSERDKNRLLDKMINMGMAVVGCDAGTLYLYKDNTLVFRVMKTLSQGVSRGENGEVIDLPPVPLAEGNVCAYAAIHQEMVNIPDVYNTDRFDFSGPRRYDAMTGYHTGSMLVVPMVDIDAGQLVGVLQLINKQDAQGNILPFTEDDEYVLRSMGSMTAVSLSAMLYTEEIKDQMHSFVQAFATAVDERTPYNGSHTRKVTIYAGLLADYINELHRKGLCEEYFDADRREQLVLSAALHDIGKMIIPLNVMNKSTRLDGRLEMVESRFALLKALYERDCLKGRISEEEWAKTESLLDESLEFIRAKDSAGFMPDDALAQAENIAAQCYVYPDGTELPWLTQEERECLCIRKGTLTAGERQIMESHAMMTRKILQKVHFNHRYSNIVSIASAHHEALNGTGYPDKLTAEQLPLEPRILAVVDVFDALTCTDRPYKKPMPREKAYAILHDMALKEGKLEDRLVIWLEQAMADITPEEIDRRAVSGWM